MVDDKTGKASDSGIVPAGTVSEAEQAAPDVDAAAGPSLTLDARDRLHLAAVVLAGVLACHGDSLSPGAAACKAIEYLDALLIS